MLKKFQAVLVAFAMMLGLGAVSVATAGPASAHVNLCTVKALKPTKVTRSTVRGHGNVYCPDVSHMHSIRVQTQVQYRSAGVYWALPPGGDSGWKPASYHFVGAGTVVVGAKNCRWYRTQARAILDGIHGKRYTQWYTGTAQQFCLAP